MPSNGIDHNQIVDISDETMIGQIRFRLRTTEALEIKIGPIRMNGERSQFFRDETLARGLEEAQKQVRFSAVHVYHLRRRHQLQPKVTGLGIQSQQSRCQIEGRDTFHCSQTDHSGRDLRGDVGLYADYGTFDGLGMAEDPFPGIGQSKAGLGALEDAQSKTALQVRDTSADRGMVYAQTLRALRQAPCPRNIQKDTQIIPVQVVNCAHRPWGFGYVSCEVAQGLTELI
ncbi:hypothetical protein SAMN04488115_109209 [Bosea lathyri]|uniref:Uncharacterized protein n=1 Tax=Bosea lathyri TaxID=1036778 RepID=A0A1H6CB90_9HYPH|nr:hypothetical protein SAMN04488115_109209 [Bosea lathyri]